MKVSWCLFLVLCCCEQIGIKEARGLPPALSNFVFCQYSYWGNPEPIVVAPQVEADTMQKRKSDGVSFRFDHQEVSTTRGTDGDKTEQRIDQFS